MDQQKRRKTTNELTYADYIANPIWTLFDDDGDDMVPVEYPGWTSEAVGGEAVDAACEFILNDGTKVPGVVGIHMYYKRPWVPYVFEFPDVNGILIDFPVKKEFETPITREEMAQFLGKTIDQVYPIRFVTPFILPSGELLAGEHR
ncbi:MAG TPA: hypothetical protein VGK87_07870 [Anaerolineae bacterium]|jgi:hypothetical protein